MKPFCSFRQAKNGKELMAVTSLNSFLEYRPWRGLRNPVWMGAFAITRESLKLIFTRKVFWVVFSLAVLNFLLYFFGQYLFSGLRISSQMDWCVLVVLGVPIKTI